MKIDVKVTNLGKLKHAELRIRPMTIITGPNGTGKSFFTKTLYSILNIINKNVYAESINLTIRGILLRLETLLNNIGHPAPAVKPADIPQIIERLLTLQKLFDEAGYLKIDSYLSFANSKLSEIAELSNLFDKSIIDLNNNPSNTGLIKNISTEIKAYFTFFKHHLKTPNKFYADLLAERFLNELQENFQISSINELISFGEQKTEIEISNLLLLKLGLNRTTYFDLESDFVDEVSSLSSVVFFESPAYWKVREALKAAKNKAKPLIARLMNADDVLTGVPKYFYDLDEALNTKTKTPGPFKAATDLLESALGGEFIFKGDNLSFTDKNGREISKNLVSFGMTNLGIMQALLKYNVITSGSFVFIDEPETNLHPDWQVILIKVLLILANAGVNIVITTHSTDTLKALEVSLKKQKIEAIDDFLSVHFIDLDGKLFEFESKESEQQLIEARTLLNSTYEQLYFSDL